MTKERTQGKECCFTVGGGILYVLHLSCTVYCRELHYQCPCTCSGCCIWKTELSFRSASSWMKKMCLCDARATVNDGFYSAEVELHPMWESLMDSWVHCEVGWHEHPLHERVRSNSHMHCKAHPSVVGAWIIQSHLYAPSKLPVQDKQTGLGPSTLLQQLTSASVKRSETASAPGKFYKPYTLGPALKQPTPFPPKAPFPIPDHSPRPH